MMDEDTYSVLRSISRAGDGISGWSKREMMRQAKWALEREDQRRHDDELIKRALTKFREEEYFRSQMP